MRRWQYCVIDGISGEGTTDDDSELRYFTEDGVRTVPVGNLAVLIANLGLDGWEMVGAGNVSDAWHALYFKKLLPGEN